MNLLKDRISSMFKKTELVNFRPLHRWNIDYSHQQINRKIDFANEDHCGPCGQKELKKVDNRASYDEIKCSPFRISNIDFMIHHELK